MSKRLKQPLQVSVIVILVTLSLLLAVAVQCWQACFPIVGFLAWFMDRRYPRRHLKPRTRGTDDSDGRESNRSKSGMNMYQIKNLREQAGIVRKMFEDAEQLAIGQGPGGTFRQGLNYIVDDDNRSVELYHQLHKLWQIIDALSVESVGGAIKDGRRIC